MCCLRVHMYANNVHHHHCTSHPASPFLAIERVVSGESVRASAWIRNRRRMHCPPTSWSRISGLTIHHSPSSPRSNPDWDLVPRAAPILNLVAGFLPEGGPGAAWEAPHPNCISRLGVQICIVNCGLSSFNSSICSEKRKAHGRSRGGYGGLSLPRMTKSDYHHLDRRKY